MQRLAKGITLIELLFVVAVISAITISLVPTIRNINNNKKLQQTADDLEGWLQAQMAYYIDKGEWAESAEALIEAEYTTEEEQCSPWKIEGAGNSACPNSSLYQVIASDSADTAYTVQVGLQTPDEEVAMQVAALLPVAQLDASEGATLVKASISAPGREFEEPERMHDFGRTTKDVEDDDKKDNAGESIDVIEPKKCPEGYKPKVAFGLSRIGGYQGVGADSDDYRFSGAINRAQVYCPQADAVALMSNKKVKNYKMNCLKNKKNQWNINVTTDSYALAPPSIKSKSGVASVGDADAGVYWMSSCVPTNGKVLN